MSSKKLKLYWVVLFALCSVSATQYSPICEYYLLHSWVLLSLSLSLSLFCDFTMFTVLIVEQSVAIEVGIHRSKWKSYVEKQINSCSSDTAFRHLFLLQISSYFYFLVVYYSPGLYRYQMRMRYWNLHNIHSLISWLRKPCTIGSIFVIIMNVTWQLVDCRVCPLTQALNHSLSLTHSINQSIASSTPREFENKNNQSTKIKSYWAFHEMIFLNCDTAFSSNILFNTIWFILL